MKKLRELFSLVENDNQGKIKLQDDTMNFDNLVNFKVSTKPKISKDDNDEPEQDEHEQDDDLDKSEKDAFDFKDNIDSKDDPSVYKNNKHISFEDEDEAEDHGDEYIISKKDKGEYDKSDKTTSKKNEVSEQNNNSSDLHKNPEIAKLIFSLTNGMSKYNKVISSLQEYSKLDSIKEKGLIQSLKEMQRDAKELIIKLENKHLTESFFMDPDEDVVSSMYNLTSNPDLILQKSLFYDFSNNDSELDEFQEYLEDSLAKYGVKSANIEQSLSQNTIHIDLEFSKNEILTFVIMIDPGSGLPKIECKAGEMRGRSQTLPTNFVGQQKVSLKNATSAFPMDFIISCINSYMPHHQLENDSLIEESLRSSVLEEKLYPNYRHVISPEGGKWMKLKSPVTRRKILSSYAKASIKRKRINFLHTSKES